MVKIDRFKVVKKQLNNDEIEFVIVDRENLYKLCIIPIPPKVQEEVMEDLAEKIALHIDELVGNNEVSL